MKNQAKVKPFELIEEELTFDKAADFVFKRKPFSKITLSSICRKRIEESHKRLQELLDLKTPIYGVTTGFGDSCHRTIDQSKAEQLQKNLVDYLACGTGENIPRDAARAVLLFRVNSLSRGYSGVSTDLIDRLCMFLEKDWVPCIPREGSLGASGDLVPLAYIAQMIQGKGEIWTNNGIEDAKTVLEREGVEPYSLKRKEGLAIVNGTSVMAGMALQDIMEARFLVALTTIATAWMVLIMKGRTESFGKFVNQTAKSFEGQGLAARTIFDLIKEEGYTPKPLREITIKDGITEQYIQDRYSIRCVPQILGPIIETVQLNIKWLETEVNGVSDNPLIGGMGELANGGNFYGGFIAHGMDYLKICLGNLADLIDRQNMMLTDEKSNRGLPPNLANYNAIPTEDRFMHHGLKGLHQAASAITSEILPNCMPNTLFSRSSESHNQDKVSLGTSASIQCYDVLGKMYNLAALHLVCLAQAIDIRGIELQGETSRAAYQFVRNYLPRVDYDQPLGKQIREFSVALRAQAQRQEGLFDFRFDIEESDAAHLMERAS